MVTIIDIFNKNLENFSDDMQNIYNILYSKNIINFKPSYFTHAYFLIQNNILINNTYEIDIFIKNTIDSWRLFKDNEFLFIRTFGYLLYIDIPVDNNINPFDIFSEDCFSFMEKDDIDLIISYFNEFIVNSIDYIKQYNIDKYKEYEYVFNLFIK